MSESIVLALLATISSTIAAILSYLGNRQGRTREKKLDHIADITNSTLTAAREALRVAEKRIIELEANLTERINKSL